MHLREKSLILACAVTLAGCAATAPTSDDSIKFMASDRATDLIEEQGKATAALLGHADDTELVCERFYKTGSHITVNYCYTRGEGDQRRLNHQEEWRNFIKGGPNPHRQKNTTTGASGLTRGGGSGGGPPST